VVVKAARYNEEHINMLFVNYFIMDKMMKICCFRAVLLHTQQKLFNRPN